MIICVKVRDVEKQILLTDSHYIIIDKDNVAIVDVK